MQDEKDLENFVEVDVEGIFIKHDFDHMIIDECEIEKYMNGRLRTCSLKQSLFVPYPYDIQTLMYFLAAQYPEVQAYQGQNEVDASMKEMSGEQ